jgi:hypothetical protein
MINKEIQRLNKLRKSIRLRMSRDASGYTETSAKLLKEMNRLSREDLSAFLKKNPDLLLDVTGGAVVKAGTYVKAAAKDAWKALEQELGGKKTAGSKKISNLKGKLEKTGVDLVKKMLSL